MYKIVEIKDLPSLENVTDFKLCYIDEISRTEYDWTEESKAIINSPGFSWNDDLKKSFLRSEEVPNPEYVKGEKEYYAFFTPIALKDQWGDDWDDAPYEHNAGTPYDTDYSNDERVEYLIIQVPFAVHSYYPKFPRDWGGYNSPFSVQDINSRAVAWLFDYHKDNSVSILAGENPLEFVDKLKQIADNYPDYVPEDDEY